MNFEELKEDVKETYPIWASSISIVFGLASLLAEFKESLPVYIIVFCSLLGGSLISYIMLRHIKKKSLSKVNPDYQILKSEDILDIIDDTGKKALYSKKITLRIKRNLSAFYIFVPRTNGTIDNYKTYIYETDKFKNGKEVSSSNKNYLDRNALFVYEPFIKNDILNIEFRWVFHNAFEDLDDSFAVHSEPYQNSCKLKVIANKITFAEWLIYYAENSQPSNRGNVDVKVIDNKSYAEFDFGSQIKSLNFKCSLHWIREN